MSIPVNKTLEEVRTGLLEKIGQVQQDGWLPQHLNLIPGSRSRADQVVGLGPVSIVSVFVCHLAPGVPQFLNG